MFKNRSFNPVEIRSSLISPENSSFDLPCCWVASFDYETSIASAALDPCRADDGFEEVRNACSEDREYPNRFEDVYCSAAKCLREQGYTREGLPTTKATDPYHRASMSQMILKRRLSKIEDLIINSSFSTRSSPRLVLEIKEMCAGEMQR